MGLFILYCMYYSIVYAPSFYVQTLVVCMGNNVDETHHRRPCERRGADAPAHTALRAGHSEAYVSC